MEMTLSLCVTLVAASGLDLMSDWLLLAEGETGVSS